MPAYTPGADAGVRHSAVPTTPFGSGRQDASRRDNLGRHDPHDPATKREQRWSQGIKADAQLADRVSADTRHFMARFDEEKYPFGAKEMLQDKPEEAVHTGRRLRIVDDAGRKEFRLGMPAFIRDRMYVISVSAKGRESTQEVSVAEHAEYRSDVGNAHW